MSDPLDADLATLKRLAGRMQSTVLSQQWAAATQERAARTSAILSKLGAIIPEAPVIRFKVDGSWRVSLEGTTTLVLTVRTRTSDGNPTGLAQPLPVHVLRPDLVDLDVLRGLELRRMISLTMETP